MLTPEQSEKGQKKLQYWIDVDKQIVTYRELAREIRCDINDAKNLLKSYLISHPTLFATYLLSGQFLSTNSQPTQSNGHNSHSKMDIDEPPASSSQVTSTSEDMEVDEKPSPTQMNDYYPLVNEKNVVKRGMWLVGADLLEEKRKAFVESSLNIQVYALSPSRIPDPAQYIPSNVRLRSYPKFMDPATYGTFTGGFELAKTSGKAESSKAGASSKPSTSTTITTKDTKPSTTTKETPTTKESKPAPAAKGIMGMFGKQKEKAAVAETEKAEKVKKAKEKAEKEEEAERARKGKGKKKDDEDDGDDEGDVDMEGAIGSGSKKNKGKRVVSSEEPEEVVEKTKPKAKATTTTKKLTAAEEEQAAMEAMMAMDDDFDMMDEEDKKPKVNPKKRTSKAADNVETSADEAAKSSKGEGNGRVKKKRRVVRSVAGVDAKGYMVMEDVSSAESYWSDEAPPKATKKTTAKKSTAGSQKSKSATPDVEDVKPKVTASAKPKVTGKKGSQSNLSGFFKKQT